MQFVGPGSAVLFLYGDGDGKATSGKELFGAKTGDGHGEPRRAAQVARVGEL